MAYSELIKNFDRIRAYMREFYIYGFKSRDKYKVKSARTYDDERRRIESWLGENMQFRRSAEGKNVFLSIDSRITRHNPLFKAWKTKSFTDGDITLHFILFDILSSPEIILTIYEIMEKIDRILAEFDEPRYFDESTVRKKLKEYVNEGLVISEKQGRITYYRRSETSEPYDTDMLDYFSEVSPCGVVGSFLLDKQTDHKDHFAFKHHYITGVLDSEIMETLFNAMGQKRYVALSVGRRDKSGIMESQVVPLRIMISVQNGRQHLMTYIPWAKRIRAYRIDNIVSAKTGNRCEEFDELREKLNGMLPHLWGVSTQGRTEQRMEHVEFVVRYTAKEPFIHERLEREKRCGTVERMDENSSRFSADVFDASEMIPWIRTFICRITEISFSNKELEKQFLEDIRAMYRMYGLEEGDLCR